MIGLATLPKEIAWHFDPKRMFSEGWQSENETKFFSKELMPGSKNYEKAIDLFNNHLEGRDVKIKAVHAIANMALVKNFTAHRGIISDRFAQWEEND